MLLSVRSVQMPDCDSQTAPKAATRALTTNIIVSLSTMTLVFATTAWVVWMIGCGRVF